MKRLEIKRKKAGRRRTVLLIKKGLAMSSLTLAMDMKAVIGLHTVS